MSLGAGLLYALGLAVFFIAGLHWERYQQRKPEDDDES